VQIARTIRWLVVGLWLGFTAIKTRQSHLPTHTSFLMPHILSVASIFLSSITCTIFGKLTLVMHGSVKGKSWSEIFWVCQ
jgi:hypothetical protein